MDYYVKSLVPIIESNYDNFTVVEKRIADFFMTNTEIADVSAKNVAAQLYVSEASLSRFAKKCGYRGYREFIYQYEKTFVEDRDSVKENSRMVLNTYQELLNKMYRFLDEKQLERVCSFLNEAKRVFVCGKGSSGIAAQEMELRFMRAGVDINAIQDGERMRMQAVFLKKSHLVIGISISGDKEEVMSMLETAKKQQAKTVLITAQSSPDQDSFCDEIILVPSLQYLNYGNLISPQFPILMVLDILYSYFVEQNRSLRASFHGDTVKALKGEER